MSLVRVRCTSKTPFILSLKGKNVDILPKQLYLVEESNPAVASRIKRKELTVVSRNIQTEYSETTPPTASFRPTATVEVNYKEPPKAVEKEKTPTKETKEDKKETKKKISKKGDKN